MYIFRGQEKGAMPISPDPTAPPASTPSKKGDTIPAHHTASPARWQGHAARCSPPPPARAAGRSSQRWPVSPVSAPGAGLLCGLSAPGLCRRGSCACLLSTTTRRASWLNVAQVLLALSGPPGPRTSGPITVPRHWVVGSVRRARPGPRHPAAVGARMGPRRGDDDDQT